MNKLLVAMLVLCLVLAGVYFYIESEQTEETYQISKQEPSSEPTSDKIAQPNVTSTGFKHELCLHGCPAGADSKENLVVRPIYLLKMNANTRFADWVAYRVSRFTIGKSKKRTWRADPDLKPELRIKPSDYKGAFHTLQTDRGHQVPLASFSATEHWHTTNYLSNITPQKSRLNQGPWKRLESKVRKLAKQSNIDFVYVMSGPLYQREMPSLPGTSKKHKIPSGYWKIIAIRHQNRLMTASFIMDQESGRHDDECQKTTTIRIIEQRTKLNFFHGLPQQQQDTFETLPGNLLSQLGCTVTARN
jgi:endonuclease G